MASSVGLRGRAPAELAYVDAGKRSMATSGLPGSEGAVDGYVRRVRHLREEASRVRRSAGGYLELAAEALAADDPESAVRLRTLAEMASCRYVAYDELVTAAEHRGQAGLVVVTGRNSGDRSLAGQQECEQCGKVL